MVLIPLNYSLNRRHYKPQAISGQFGGQNTLAPAENEIPSL